MLCTQGSARGHGWRHVLVALGKLAVHDASLSSKMAALFLREVERAASPVLRNNLLIILTDLCVRHTALVDPHINKLALCLRDDNEVVRKHALTLITNLLATDYVKWRGTLFFRYLVALVDESLLIREQVDAARKRVLMQARHVHTPSACVHVDSRLLLHTAVSAFHPMSKNLNRGRYARQARQSLFRMLLPKSNFLACSAHFVESVFVLRERVLRVECDDRFLNLAASNHVVDRRAQVERRVRTHVADAIRVLHVAAQKRQNVIRQSRQEVDRARQSSTEY